MKNAQHHHPPAACRHLNCAGQHTWRTGRLDWVERELRSFLGHAGAQARFVFGASVYAVTLLGPLVAGKFGAFAGLGLADRMHVLEKVEKSFLSTPLLGVKAILCIVYFEHPEAARHIGATGECLKP